MKSKVTKGLSIILIFTLLLSSFISFPTNLVKAEEIYATDLFFSEYIEGGSYNKALEIYNGTGNTIDLSTYKVELYSNGASTPGSTLTLSGTLENGGVYIIAYPSAVDTIKSIANTTSGVANFNGDDAIVLKNGDTIIDVFGQVGVDPGSAWGTGDNTTMDHTLVRKSNITSGDTNSTDVFDPAGEWDSYPKDTFTYLGSHTMDGTVQPNVPVTGVTLNQESISVYVGKEKTITATVEPVNATNKAVFWSSNNTAVATVDNGKVTGLTDGTATITVTTEDGAFQDSALVTVIPITELSIAEARAKAIGDYVTVTGVVTYKDGSNNYIQDETAAIDLYKYGLSLNVGDEVKVTGALQAFNGLLEVVPDATTDVEVISSNNALPAPKLITIADISDDVEGQLVKVENVTIGTINTTGNTSITDKDGQTINIYKIPALTDIVAGDQVDVIAILSDYKGFQLRVRGAEDVTKVELGPDATAPVITHTPVTSAHISENIEIRATVTDDRFVESVTLYYRVKEQVDYKTLTMELNNGQYIATIPTVDLDTAGMEYYIEAYDGVNTTKLPDDISIPFEILMSDEDITEPEVTNLQPISGTYTGANLRPVVSAEYSDVSGINQETVQLFVDNLEVTADAIVTSTNISYQPNTDLTIGKHTVKLIVADNAPTPQTAIVEWDFYVGEQTLQFFYGQLHSHTNLSDGQGTPDDAYTWARDNAQADFFAITDHSNWFDSDLDYTKSSEWALLKEKANEYNADGSFVAIGGFEMTWSGSTGGWGHINTFNTDWFESRSNPAMNLEAYYNKIAQYPESISQLNHPGNTFGDFADFGFYNQAVDNVVHLIEVGNGEGAVRSSGYFPSYDYYTKALDKGWHVAPSNNQDNHLANWVSANDARTVVLAEELTRENIYDAIRQMRVYATEDKNLELTYKVNGQMMGTILDNPETLNMNIQLNDPDTTDQIGKVSIIANGGVVVASKTFTTNTANWQFQLAPQYSYYYVRVDQSDKDIAVSAPVWTGEVVPVGISKVEVSQDPTIVNSTVEVSSTIYNNSNSELTNIEVKFYKDAIKPENEIGSETISAIAPGKSGIAKVSWIADKVGKPTLYAQATIHFNGTDKVFTGSTRMTIANKEDLTKVVLDAGHYNQYVSGDYAGKMLTLKQMLRDKQFILYENPDEITAEDLQDAKILILTDPQSYDDTRYNLQKSLYTDAEVAVIKEFMENGGSLIITSRADYKDPIGEYGNAAQGNKVLEAINSNLRFNDDEVVDNTSNGGQPYRLYFDQYISSKYDLTNNVPEGYTYSYYSGNSVILKENADDTAVDFLIKGHSTTETIDADSSQFDRIPVAQGDVKVLAAEILPGGGKVIVAGSTFFSDFETAASDNAYSNKQITENVLNWMAPPKEIPLVSINDLRVDADHDGTPDLLGKTFKIEGRVTAESEAYTKAKNRNNAFFEVLYVQDETGGITVFGVSQKEIPLGAKVRITGWLDQYDGDLELSIENEETDLVVLEDPIELVEPKLMTTADSMLEENEGWLVKVEGIVTRMTDNTLYINDGTGEARVYVNGYIGDGTENTAMLGKWDSSIAVGDRVSAIGLSSEDASGKRLRVRNTAEIVLIKASTPTRPNPSDNVKQTENGKATITKDEDGHITVTLELDSSKMIEKIEHENSSKVTIDVVVEEDASNIGVSLESDLLTKAMDKNKTLAINIGVAVIEINSDSIKINENSKVLLQTKVVKEEDATKLFHSKDVDQQEVSSILDFDLFLQNNNQLEKISFNKPITVVFQLDSSKVNNSKKLGVYYYNEETMKWEYVGGKNATDNSIQFDAKHFSKYTVMESKKSFVDIEIPWAKEQIEVLAAKQIVKGKDDTHYAPEDLVTRAEFASLLVRSLQLQVGPNKVVFNDLTADWYKNAIEIAASQGIVIGSNGSFNPNGAITREEMAVILMRTLMLLEGNEKKNTEVQAFNDANLVAEWAKEAVGYIANQGLITGIKADEFAPKQKATRAQTAVIIYRLLELLEEL